MNLVPTVKITLDSERTLRLDLNAFCDFEAKTGKNLMHGIDPTQMMISDLRALLWACLVQEDVTLKLEEVGKMVGIENAAEITAALFSLFKRSMPEADGGGPLPLASAVEKTSASNPSGPSQ